MALVGANLLEWYNIGLMDSLLPWLRDSIMKPYESMYLIFQLQIIHDKALIKKETKQKQNK